MFFKTFCCLTFLVSFSAMAVLKLDVVIVRKSGMSKGLVLISELHFSEIIKPGKEEKLKSKTGIEFFYKTDFFNDNEYGPSHKLSFVGSIKQRDRKDQLSITKAPLVLELGKTTHLEMGQGTDQVFEISLHPRVE